MSFSHIVVPRGGIPTLCIFRNGNLVELRRVPVSSEVDIITSVDGWSAWWHEHDMIPVYCTRDWKENSVEEMLKFTPPAFRHGVDVIAFRGNELWMMDGGNTIWTCDLGSSSRELQSVISPVTESIKQIAFHSDDIFAVAYFDPLRLQRMKYDSGNRLNVDKAVDLERRNLDDVHGLIANSKWVVVLSSTFSFCEESCYLNVFDAETLTELSNSKQVSVTVDSLFVYGNAGQPVQGAPDWKQVAWMGKLGKEGRIVENDLLVIASGWRGVGLWDLSSANLDEPFEEEITYIDVPGFVQKVIPCPQWGVVLAISEEDNVLETHVVPIHF